MTYREGVRIAYDSTEGLVKARASRVPAKWRGNFEQKAELVVEAEKPNRGVGVIPYAHVIPIVTVWFSRVR